MIAPMAISGDYSSLVRVNGFACRNRAEVDQAKRNFNPASPTGGPFGINDHGKSGGKARVKAGAKAGAAKSRFSAEARQLDQM